MALTPFFGSGRTGILDPFDLGFWDPVDSWPSNFFGRNVGRDVQAVASTRIDWVETPEAHVFKADLPGKYDITLNPYIHRSHFAEHVSDPIVGEFHGYDRNVLRNFVKALNMQYHLQYCLQLDFATFSSL
jgi:hypothetical protein